MISKLSGLVIKSGSSKIKLEELLELLKKLNYGTHVVQLLDSRAIVNRNHVLGAYVNALAAFKNKTNKTKSIAMEMLLFTAFTDQINKAIEIVGAKTNSDLVLFTNSKDALGKLIGFNISGEFNPSEKNSMIVAKHLGIDIKNKKKIDESILEKMALSRLQSS
jgi:tRNA threonylcarbamoyladenosine modification (KEOPS) complex Cgi121 subunit